MSLFDEILNSKLNHHTSSSLVFDVPILQFNGTVVSSKVMSVVQGLGWFLLTNYSSKDSDDPFLTRSDHIFYSDVNLGACNFCTFFYRTK
jgi:hypothetical protein